MIQQQGKEADVSTPLPKKEEAKDGDEESEHYYWQIYTELDMYLPDEKRRRTLRCHPNYHNEGPYYDFVYVNFETKEGEEARQGSNGPYPCKVLAFVQGLPEEIRDGEEKVQKTYALVHCADYQIGTKAREHENSVLYKHWYLEYVAEDSAAKSKEEQYFRALLRLVDITSISAACYGFEERRIVVSEGHVAADEVRRTERQPQYEKFRRRHYRHLITATYPSLWPSRFWNHSNTASTPFNPEDNDSSEESDED